MTLSVIIPAYNAEKTLLPCCESILRGQDAEMEVILVDDGSTDGTPALCDAIAAQDGRVKVIHTPNGGPGSARNKGMEAAAGEWIAFTDADDTCGDGYFTKMLDQAADADLVIQGLEMEKRYGQGEIALCIAENDLLEKGSPWGKLFRKSIIEAFGIRFPENYRYGEDTVFFLRYLGHCGNILCKPDCGYRYTVDDAESLSRKVHDSIDLMHYIIDSKEAVKPFLTERRVADRHNVKCVFYAKRAWNNMFRLGWDRIKRKEARRVLRKEVLPLLRFNGLNWRECGYLILLHLSS